METLDVYHNVIGHDPSRFTVQYKARVSRKQQVNKISRNFDHRAIAYRNGAPRKPSALLKLA